MELETQKRLDSVLEAYSAKMRQEKEDAEHEQQERHGFVAEFTQCRSEVIKPALAEIGEMLKAHGHDYTIVESKVQVSQGKRPVDSALASTVGLEVRPADMQVRGQNKDGLSTLTFTGNPLTRQVETQMSLAAKSDAESGLIATGPSFAVGQVDGVMIQSATTEFLEQVLRSH
jgi:hypothetical protein